jgi:malate synthase
LKIPTHRFGVNNIDGQINLRDAITAELSATFNPDEAGKEYKLNEQTATLLMVRPRGWHLNEKHVLVDGEVMSGSLFDFGFYSLSTMPNSLLANGTGPYFYLTKNGKSLGGSPCGMMYSC